MLEQWIGKQSVPVKNTIERGAVKKFAVAIGDRNPLYIDELYAKTSRYQGLIAPPTFVQTLEYGKIEGMPVPRKGVVHGEQKYMFTRPLQVGEDIWCYAKLADVYEKKGSNGLLTFVVTDRIGEDRRGERIYTATTVTVWSESVRKELGV